MSYREVRSFVEAMKSLGYPRLISMDNFRNPNFELVADCLHWLVQRFYPESSISDDIATEAERVAFLQGVAQVMSTKARMKLNLRRLYAADGQAVRELLKLAGLLLRATQSAEAQEEDPADAGDVAAALRALDPRAAKALAADAVRAGAALHDALAAEPALREARARALAGAQDADHVERCIAEALAGVEEALGGVRSQISELASAEAALDSKLERRRAELERAEKRLATLAAVRPAYMDEYEALEGQLQVLYTHYLERHRNLQYLEAQLEGYHRAEQDAMDAEDRRLRKMQKRLAEEELRILRGEQEVDESRMGASASTPSDSDGDDDDGGGGRGSSRGGSGGDQWGGGGGRPARGKEAGRGGGGRRPAAAPAVMGSLGGGGGWAGDEEEESIDEDTATDGGDVSLAGSGDPGAALGRGALVGEEGGGEDGEEEGDLLDGGSDDSGF